MTPPYAYVGQTYRKLSTGVKEHTAAIIRQDESSLFDWVRAAVIGNVANKLIRDCIEA